MPVNVICEWVGEGRSTEDGLASFKRSKQKNDIVSNPCNEIGVRDLRDIRLNADRAFELRIGGEPSTTDGSGPDTIDIKFNLAFTDADAWLKRGVEVCLDRAV